MEKYINLLESKYGKFEKKQHYFRQKQLPYNKNKAYLNLMFEPIDKVYYNKVEELLGFKFPEELNELFKKSNGVSLFNYSLILFGINRYEEDYFRPEDMVKTNLIINYPNRNPSYANYVCIGIYGEKYFITIDTKKDNSVYLINKQNDKVEQKFDSFTHFFDYYFFNLYEEYKEDGKRKHPNLEFSGTAYENKVETLL